MTDFSKAVEYVHSIGEWRSMKLGLERFTEFCARLGNPQEKFRSVHVAGTNGKGSTIAMIASILQAAGYKVGSYYSPFVYDIRERFLLNGEMISEADFARLVEQIRPVAEEMEQTEHGHPTEFEMKTAVAFLYFAENNVDFAVLETGLGGRLDATNIVNPLVSVITNVSMDHMEHLGDTIEQIAAEKAGIIKPNGHCVTAATGPALEVIRQRCEERDSSLWTVTGCGERYRIMDEHVGELPADMECGGSQAVAQLGGGKPARKTACENGQETASRDCLDSEQVRILPETPVGEGYATACKPAHSTGVLRVDGMHSTYHDLNLGLRGDFQRTNAALAVAAIEALREECGDIPETAIYSGLETAFLPGRLQVLRENPTLVIDGAHNPDAAHRLADALREWFTYDRLILVMGMVKGHSAEDVVAILAPLADKFIATAPSDPRATSAESVADAARKYCEDVTVVEPVPAAVDAALASAGENDLILVTGSFYTIGEVPRT